MIRTYWRLLAALCLVPAALFVTSAQAAESCYTAPEMDASARAGIESAAQQLFSAAAAGNTSAMQQNSIAAIANSFQGIANVVQANKDKIAGGKPTFAMNGCSTLPAPSPTSAPSSSAERSTRCSDRRL